MGSYLTIVNDTPDPWHCKVGPDMRALAVAAIIAAIVAIAAGLYSMGALVLVAGATSVGLGIKMWVYKVDPRALLHSSARHPDGVVPGDSPTQIGYAIAETLVKKLHQKGFKIINGGDRRKYGKMTLSLWQQSDCKRVFTNGPDITIQTMMLRPIFSGAKDKSNRDYAIDWWLKKYGTDDEGIRATSDEPPKK